MDKKGFIRKLGISVADEKTIVEKVQEAESKTTGEIALAIARQSDDYSKFELLVALLVGLVFSFVFLIFADNISKLLAFRAWSETIPPKTLVITFMVGLGVLIALFFALANIPAVERLFLSKAVRFNYVRKRAHLHFFDSGLYKTKDQTGILIFVSVMERVVYIYADEGINAKVQQSQWQGICDSLVASIKQKKAGAGLIQAVEQCGEILAKNCPAKQTNPNELPDGLVVL